MRGAEGVVDVRVGERAVALRELRVVLRLAGVETDVLEQDDVVVGHLVELRREPDVLAQQLLQAVADGPQRQLRVRALRPPEMAGQDEPRAPLAQRAERGQRGTDPRVVGDLRAVERDVEVDPDEDPFTGDVAQVGEGPHEETGWATRTCCARSTTLLE